MAVASAPTGGSVPMVVERDVAARVCVFDGAELRWRPADEAPKQVQLSRSSQGTMRLRIGEDEVALSEVRSVALPSSTLMTLSVAKGKESRSLGLLFGDEATCQDFAEELGRRRANYERFEQYEPSSVQSYFQYYAKLTNQQNMLQDSVRTSTYRRAIIDNAADFRGKAAMDVGAGSGILSIFAARAGAKMVYAVEATDMAERAKRIVEANGLGERIKVLQGTLETITLPCKVDVIVSEWMGYFLLRESMLDSVLIARDKHLKPGGSMFPSHATLYLTPLTQTKMLGQKMTQWEGEMQHWATFSQDMSSWYETDFSCVREEFIREQRQYYLQTGSFVNLNPKQTIGPAKPLLELDLLTASLEELQAPTAPQTCTMRITRDGVVEGFCGYFDAFFRGSPSSPAEQDTTLTTAPATGTSTHWGQQAFGFYPPLQAKRGDLIECTMRILRQERNHRLLRLETKFVHFSQQGAERVVKAEREEVYFVD